MIEHGSCLGLAGRAHRGVPGIEAGQQPVIAGFHAGAVVLDFGSADMSKAGLIFGVVEAMHTLLYLTLEHAAGSDFGEFSRAGGRDLVRMGEQTGRNAATAFSDAVAK